VPKRAVVAVAVVPVMAAVTDVATTETAKAVATMATVKVVATMAIVQRALLPNKTEGIHHLILCFVNG
jgi:hypothetical protein